MATMLQTAKLPVLEVPRGDTPGTPEDDQRIPQWRDRDHGSNSRYLRGHDKRSDLDEVVVCSLLIVNASTTSGVTMNYDFVNGPVLSISVGWSGG